MAAKVTSGYYSKFSQKVNTNDFKSNVGAAKSSKADFITQNSRTVGTTGTAKTAAKVTKASNNKDINLNNPKTVNRGKTPRPTTNRDTLGQTQRITSTTKRQEFLMNNNANKTPAASA